MLTLVRGESPRLQSGDEADNKESHALSLFAIVRYIQIQRVPVLRRIRDMLLRGTRSRSRRPRVGLDYSHTTAAHPAANTVTPQNSPRVGATERRDVLMAQPSPALPCPALPCPALLLTWLDAREWSATLTHTLTLSARAGNSERIRYPRISHHTLVSRAEIASANPHGHSRSHQECRITDGGIPPYPFRGGRRSKAPDRRPLIQGGRRHFTWM